MSGPYDDIIELPHHTSERHPRMTAAERAAQFSPFAALSGYDAAIGETARFTDSRIELSEDEKSELDMKLRGLSDRIDEHPKARITWFVPDARKSGGSYEIAEGAVKKIDEYGRAVVMADGIRIPIDDIIEVEG